MFGNSPPSTALLSSRCEQWSVSSGPACCIRRVNLSFTGCRETQGESVVVRPTAPASVLADRRGVGPSMVNDRLEDAGLVEGSVSYQPEGHHRR
jgi:hypothetical protein